LIEGISTATTFAGGVAGIGLGGAGFGAGASLISVHHCNDERGCSGDDLP
jgi:hypothetical protein